MQVVLINTGTIPDLKLVAENEVEVSYLRQLAEAGTLSIVTASAGSEAIFRPITVVEEDYSGNTANASNSIGRFNFDLRQNEQKVFDFNFSSSETAIDLSSYDYIALQVKSSKGGAAVVSLYLTAGLQVLGDDNSKLRVTFTAAQTEKLHLPVYYYDILFKWGANSAYSVEGIINVLSSVTR